MTFAEAVREILADASTAPERPTPGSLAERIAREAERYLDRVRFDPAQYVRHPVLLWDDWEVMLIGWEAGQITPIHDHRGVLGGMADALGLAASKSGSRRRDSSRSSPTRGSVPRATSRDIGPTTSAPLDPDDSPGPSRSTSTGLRCARWGSGTNGE